MSDNKSVLKVTSREEVALELCKKIADMEKIYEDKANYRKNLLDLYVECFDATGGYRPNNN